MRSEQGERKAETSPHPSPAATPSPQGEGFADGGAPAIILAANRVGGPCEGMRRIRSDGELPAEVLEYIELVEGNRPRACKEQHALAALIRRLANEEG